MSSRAAALIAMGVGVAVALGACTSPTEQKPEPTTSEAPVEKAPASAPANEEALELAEGWSRLEMDGLSGDPADKLAEARKAMKTLGSTLMKELTAAVGEQGDYAKGVEVCKKVAPRIAETVSEEYEVEIGRTSFKLRNPANAPKPWAEPIVEQRVAEELFMKGPNGQLAYMAPIRLGAPCVHCHGTASQIPDEVEQILAREYPKDEATGFAPGDLRGWFWVKFSGS